MPRRRAPVLAFLTDFGDRDAYVASMKGVALRLLPEVRLVDVAHGIDRGDVLGGALVLEEARRWFPAGTVFVAVVDPGVGTARRGLAAAAHGQTFVGPDNGILWPVLRGDPGARIHSIENPDVMLERVSDTFHGRDVFTPAACALAAGLPLAKAGPAVARPAPLPGFVAERGRAKVRGQVLRVDRFGNLVTSVTEEDLDAVFPRGRREALAVDVGVHRVRRNACTYGTARAGEPFFLLGSGGRLEVAVRDGSAAAELAAERGARVVVRERGAGK